MHNSFGFMLAHAQLLFEGQTDLKTLIDSIVDLLCDALTAKPSLPSFIVNILNESPELLTAIPFIKEEQIPFLLDQLLLAGLDHIQITLESHEAAIHDRMVGVEGAWQETVEGIKTVVDADVYMMTNTTMTTENVGGIDHHLLERRDLGVGVCGTA